MRILSTKKLTQSQKELLLNATISFVEYDSIHFTYEIHKAIEAFNDIIVTSKNGIISLLKNNVLTGLKNKNWYCVGEKTAQALIENDIKPIEIGENAVNLAQKLVKNHQKSSFAYFCGNLKRSELNNILSKNEIELNEIEVYQTHFNDKKINGDFNGILFFSPSGIKSYLKQNSIDQEMLFCIGNTTAKEAKKHTGNIIISNKPTVENTIVQVVKYANSERPTET
ncbi:uroporphyrinogen-III synthase [Spongiivirga citrea]|uniref:Uroporphyrinogen-III synthase n=1 Tax=Spongiivirga citrea TaxID=1481457 RepID=A0A6M0CSL9_9FLAO|nr:uroporphyrinogen-III synthase [Spongiivirga citrea]NER19084.1 uroporphyrinogen-III synthase [Spongiivirga citrea]